MKIEEDLISERFYIEVFIRVGIFTTKAGDGLKVVD